MLASSKNPAGTAGPRTAPAGSSHQGERVSPDAKRKALPGLGGGTRRRQGGARKNHWLASAQQKKSERQGRSRGTSFRQLRLSHIKPIHDPLIGGHLKRKAGLDAEDEFAIPHGGEPDGGKTGICRLRIALRSRHKTSANIVLCDFWRAKHAAIFGICPGLSRDTSQWTR